ncbi:MAG: hypothetical protein IPK26_31465 [Planctomycetes bacterium]|nr:hypothetical protein [Planctomycetota bacterium]
MPEQLQTLRAGFAVLALLTGIPRSQDPHAAERTASPIAVAMRPAPAMAMVHGAALASGDRYEAGLVGGTVDFRPVYGIRAPRSTPWRFQFESLWRGDDLVLTTGKEAPAVELSGKTASFVRSPTVLERYEARADGLAQSFEFRQPILGNGDLIVRGRITTGLRAERRKDGSLAFVEPGVGGVHVGTVTGIDALGRTAPGRLHLAGDMLELTLPAAFVEGAVWPLVLDPLIGTFFDPTFESFYDNITPDVAYDATNDVYQVVWARVFSATDHAIRGQRVSSTGTQVGALQFLTPNPPLLVYSRPRVCNVNASDRFLVTWSAPGTGGVQVVQACGIVAASGAHTAPVVLVAPTFIGQPRDALNHVVAGDLSTNNQGAILCYQAPSGAGGVHAARVEVPPTGDPVIQAGNTTALWGSIFVPLNGLGISKTGGSAGRHVVMMSHFGELRARVVDRNAQAIGSAIVVSTTVNGRNYAPAVDGNGSEFIAVWAKEQGSGATTRDIQCVALTASGAGLALSGTASRLDVGRPGDSANDPDIVFLGGKYAACYERTFWDNPGWDDLRLAILLADCSVCGPWHLTFGPGFPTTYLLDNSPRLIGHRTGSTGGDDQGLVVWADADEVAADSDIRAQLFVSRSNGLSPTVIAPGCGNGGTAGTTGSGFVFGNQSFAMTVNGADPNAILFCSIAFPTTPIVCGPCSFLPGSIDFVPNAGGSATRPFPVPCDGVFVDALLQFQWLGFNGGSSPCGAAPGLSASAILQLQLVP